MKAHSLAFSATSSASNPVILFLHGTLDQGSSQAADHASTAAAAAAPLAALQRSPPLLLPLLGWAARGLPQVPA
jgi:hypothetical protein